MNRKYILFALIALVFFIVIYSLNSGNSAYVEGIKKIQEEKINFLSLSPDSPVKEKINRSAIQFFEPQKKYKVKAKIAQIPDVGRVELATNDGSIRPYIKFARAIFEIDGLKDSLIVFIEPTFNANYKKAFIPFKDKTSGVESYAAGRYLDAEIKDDSFIELDFNLAYNPFCAYDEKFSCPLPPESNYLDIRIEAGEKNYK